MKQGGLRYPYGTTSTTGSTVPVTVLLVVVVVVSTTKGIILENSERMPSVEEQRTETSIQLLRSPEKISAQW